MNFGRTRWLATSFSETVSKAASKVGVLSICNAAEVEKEDVRKKESSWVVQGLAVGTTAEAEWAGVGRRPASLAGATADAGFEGQRLSNFQRRSNSEGRSLEAVGLRSDVRIRGMM